MVEFGRLDSCHVAGERSNRHTTEECDELQLIERVRRRSGLQTQ